MASLSSESRMARLEPVHDVRAQDLRPLTHTLTVKKGPGPGDVPSAAEQLISEAPPSSPHEIPISVEFCEHAETDEKPKDTCLTLQDYASLLWLSLSSSAFTPALRQNLTEYLNTFPPFPAAFAINQKLPLPPCLCTYCRYRARVPHQAALAFHCLTA